MKSRLEEPSFYSEKEEDKMPTREIHQKRLEKRILTYAVELLLKEGLSEEIGLTTLSRCELSSDRKIAHIYYVVYQEKEKKKKLIQQILQEKLAPLLRKVVARKLRMRYIPRIYFLPDENLEKLTSSSFLLDTKQEEKEPKENAP